MKRVIIVIICLFVFIKVLDFIAGNCKISEDCYLCLGLSASTNPEFSPAKFNQIKIGWSLEKVNKLIGKPFSGYEINMKEKVAFYSGEKNLFSSIGYTSFQIIYDENNKVIETIVCNMD